MVNRKHAFWQAFLVAVLIFGIGMILGIYYENSRTEAIQTNLLSSEINLLDSQLIGGVTDTFNVSCTVSKQNLIDFANKIYSEAVLMEEYDGSSQLTGTLKVIHKRYDLLRVLLWNEVIKYNKDCNGELKTAVYLYAYDEPSAVIKSKQVAFGRYLEDLKGKYGNRFILIPMAGDLNLNSIEIIKASYTIDELPVVIVNEKQVIGKVEDLFEVEKVLFE